MACMRRKAGLHLAAVIAALLPVLVASRTTLADDVVPLLPKEWSVVEKPLGPPRGLHAEASSETSATVRWEPLEDPGDLVEYEVFRDGGPIARTRGHSFEDVALRSASTHCYSVQAVDEVGRSSPPGEVVCVTTPDLTQFASSVCSQRP